jgi:hypothetical protein
VASFKNIFRLIEAAWSRVRARFAGRLALIAIFVPIALAVLALGAYGLWWRTVADGVREQVAQFQAMQRALGRDVRWESFAVGGFPYRVEGTLSTLHFTAPDRGSAWDGDKIVVHVPPLSLNRIALSFEGQQHYFYARERWIETNARADKALVTLAQGSDGRSRINIDIERLTGKAKYDETDFNFIVDTIVGGVRIGKPANAKDVPRVDAAARLENVALQGGFDLPLGSSIQLIDFDAGLPVPVNMPEPSLPALMSEWRRTGAPIDLRRFELAWGGVTIAATGAFKLDANALPEGQFRVKLGNHPRILELLEAYGWINAETRARTKKVLDVLAFMSGDKQRRVTVPFRIEKGDIFIGPAKVASLLPAPTAAVAPAEAPDTALAQP